MSVPHSPIEENFLLSYAERDNNEKDVGIRSGRPSRNRRLATKWTFALSVALNTILLGCLFFSFPRHVRCNTQDGGALTWSPVQDIIPWTETLFPKVTQRSEYSGPPNDDVDAAWDSLYTKYQISAVPQDQATTLPNSTLSLSRDGHPKYLVGLDVFHQLHCLDRLRRSRYPDRYSSHHHEHFVPLPPTPPGEPPFDHLDHCINSIRHSLVCNADLTPNVVQWDPETQFNTTRLDVVHNCRDFEKVKEWASQNMIEK